MPINGVTSSLPDQKYIKELEATIERLTRQIEALQGVVANQGRR